ncbi:MAG: hypothetical protein AAF108_01535 [Planctomycetota bacterium]
MPTERPRRGALISLAALLLLSPLAGCNTLGPRSLRTGRSLYNEAIAQTQNEQVLLNLVRLRYRDAPVFLEVSTVATTYEIETGASSSLAAGLNLSQGPPGSNSIGAGLSGTYTERPTMTMIPLQGERFATRLLSPIRLRVLALMANSGWSLDRLLAVTVQRLGPLPNAPSASGPTPTSAPEFDEFRRFAAALRELQQKHDLTLAMVRDSDDSGGGDVALEFQDAALDDPAYADAMSLLGLDPAARVRRIVFSTDQSARPGTIPITTRSLLSAMFYLSHAVEPSNKDLERGVVTQTFGDEGDPFDWSRVLGAYFRVRSGGDRSSSAGPSIRYRGRWYWIDDSDLTSKSTLNVLHQLFALQSGQIENVGPVLTIPVTGG